MNDVTVAGDAGAFFESYRLAFEGRDEGAIADHFAYPCHVTGDGPAIAPFVAADRAAWCVVLGRLLEQYRLLGVATASIEQCAVTEVSPRLAQAWLRWSLRDAGGAELYAFHAAYTLGRIAGAVRVTAIAHDESPRMRECLARLGGGK